MSWPGTASPSLPVRAGWPGTATDKVDQARNVIVTPTPSPAVYSVPDKLYFATIGQRLPNKDGTCGAGFTKSARYAYHDGPICDVPAGGKLATAITNFKVFEDDDATNEVFTPAEFVVEALSLIYVDDTGATRIVQPTLSNGGVASATIVNGGVLAVYTLPAKMPRGQMLKFGIAIGHADGARVPCLDSMRTDLGDTFRKHATTSFAATVNANAALTANAGSAAGNYSGFYPDIALIAAWGMDGRPVLFGDGDSIMYGKGTPFSIALKRMMGIVEPALATTANGGYRVPLFNSSVAGSGIVSTDPSRAEYNPNIRQHTRALIQQIIVENGGVVPFSHYLAEGATNSIQPTGAGMIALVKTRIDWLQAWINKPAIQTTMIPKSKSTNGFRDLAGQSPFGTSDASNGTRFLFNDALLASKLDGKLAYAVNTYAAVSYDTGANRDKYKVAPFSTTVTRAVTAGDTVVFTAAAPTIGAALCLDPQSGNGQSRIVIAIAEITAGVEYQVTTFTGSSAGTYAAKAAGTTIAEHYTADGQTAVLGLHITKPANDLIAAYAGADGFQGLKAALLAASPVAFPTGY